MKKLLFFFLILMSVSGRAQTEEETLLQEFLHSPDYAGFIAGSQFAGSGTLDMQKSFVDYRIGVYNEIEKRLPVLCLQFVGVQNGKKVIVGQIEAIKVREDYTGLPKNGRYLMLYKNYLQYNTGTSTGTIRVYDLNYDEYLVGEAAVTNGTVNNYTPYPMPDNIAAKYNLTGRAPHPCDTNHNGNVTYGECFSCMLRSCMSDPECRFLCFLANLYRSSCFNSMRVSCAILAIIY
ncbi:MAG: hypothetical protein HYZ15_10060 [Sphingobacteriales bacterium]|nr:hypothetical protein [Sphingobacteriales bacterium]